VSSPPPKGSDAMKAVLTDERFDDPEWIYERKLDGIRCIAVRDGGTVKLLSRNDLDLGFADVAKAIEQQKGRFAIDGEVVALVGDQTSFEALARRGHDTVPLTYYVFDILWIDGEDVRSRPLRERKQLLKDTIEFHDPLRFTEHRNEHGVAYFEEACRKGWEGVIAKCADSPYASKRSKDWLKFKCDHGQELVIGGFTEPRGTRIELGALLLGVYEGDRLRYAGKVGTGFDHKTLARLGHDLTELEIDESPFDHVHPIPRGTHWVRPELVGQFGFAEWTRDGRLRHPRYLGLRDDKPAREVVRERPS
jgi:DNA ligase D-like protein (predicted ligase)